ncbi:hypothetical protein Syun_019295 [Stephania yunnanensis]|uniref:Uncharacterized protein n=1 Tax=Stephania yunnanensis TaxID=152371 RepID=A0AAP0ITU6_9MAGN
MSVKLCRKLSYVCEVHSILKQTKLVVVCQNCSSIQVPGPRFPTSSTWIHQLALDYLTPKIRKAMSLEIGKLLLICILFFSRLFLNEISEYFKQRLRKDGDVVDINFNSVPGISLTAANSSEQRSSGVG